MLPANLVGEFLTRSFHEQGDGVSAYWVEAHESRRAFCRSLATELGGLPILAVPVGTGEFTDANGVIDELSQLIGRNQQWFDAARREAITNRGRFAILLVSRRPLGVPQMSSPVQLPDWFPVWPGHLLTVAIRNITHLVDVSLADPMIPVALVCKGLYSLEDALQIRLLSVLDRQPNGPDALWKRIAADKGSAASLQAQIAEAKKAVGEVSDSGKFRPGGGSGSPFLVSRLFRLWWKCSPDDLHKLSEDLSDALGVRHGELVPRQYSLSTLLSRTAIPSLTKTPVGVTFCRNAIVSLANAMQFSTAAAHAADYPRLPAILTGHYAQDLAKSCQFAAESLDSIVP